MCESGSMAPVMWEHGGGGGGGGGGRTDVPAKVCNTI